MGKVNVYEGAFVCMLVVIYKENRDIQADIFAK